MLVGPGIAVFLAGLGIVQYSIFSTADFYLVGFAMSVAGGSIAARGIPGLPRWSPTRQAREKRPGD
ncbi:hypothetical protein JIG36_00395 [Actinoplanes sp. LDG1-06]|uniref:Uncharacterized protein n=1 Tax=Paractinoplanes ovalisporus TaxID=2810368 RepID=A0ABS2A2F3_9ACTN|nr:hypothetical protein [Actinoplanes ovalisporus]MBM2614013.1 hypothetical protein [Actinoplanes ovalisporus]